MEPESELTTMGKKGQVVIPKSIRDRLGLGPQSKFVVFSSGDLIVMKRLTIPDVRKRLEEAFEAIDRRDLGLTEEDVYEEIQAMRKEKREQATDEKSAR